MAYDWHFEETEEEKLARKEKEARDALIEALTDEPEAKNPALVWLEE